MIRELLPTIFHISQPLMLIIQPGDIMISNCLMSLSQRFNIRYLTRGLISMVKKQKTCYGKVSMNNNRTWQRLDRIMLQVNTIMMMITIKLTFNIELEIWQVWQTIQESKRCSLKLNSTLRKSLERNRSKKVRLMYTKELPRSGKFLMMNALIEIKSRRFKLLLKHQCQINLTDGKRKEKELSILHSLTPTFLNGEIEQ